MDRKEEGDVIHAVQTTFAFYGKQLDDLQRGVWSRIVRDSGYTAFQWKDVLRKWFTVGKFAPRPAEIMELLSLNVGVGKTRAEPTAPLTTDCPPETAKAWTYWLPIFWGEALPFASNVIVDESQAEKYLHIVNHEAKRVNAPESIPNEYKLEEVWGDIQRQSGIRSASDPIQVSNLVHDEGSNRALSATKEPDSSGDSVRKAGGCDSSEQGGAEPREGPSGGSVRGCGLPPEMAQVSLEIPWNAG
jgi:hypothetical protein